MPIVQLHSDATNGDHDGDVGLTPDNAGREADNAYQLVHQV